MSDTFHHEGGAGLGHAPHDAGSHQQYGGHAGQTAGQPHGLLGHLLGTHQTHHVGQHVATAGSGSNNPFLVNSLDTLKGVRWSDVFKGIEIPRSLIVGMIISSMFLWLCAIYWIRHHEPVANQVIGVGTVQAMPNMQDRQLMDSVNRAMPIPTQARLETQSTTLNGQNNSPARQTTGNAYLNNGAGATQAAVSTSRQAYYEQAAMQSTNAYHLPVTSVGVTRLKTVVTR